MSEQYAIGVDMGPSKVFCGVFDEEMHLVKAIQKPNDQELTPKGLMDRLEAYVREVLSRANVDLSCVRGLGAAFPSHIDYEQGVVLETADIYALSNLPVKSILEKRLSVPVWLDNNSNAAALAEHRLGAGRGYRDMIYVSVATGVGGGLILNGELYRGIHGAAGEIGHMFVSDSTGYPCGCGVTGCVESIASGAYMARYAMDRIKEGRESRILDFAGTMSRIDMVVVAKAFAEGDKLATEVIERGAEYLGRMFQSLYQIFDINVFVYGGGVMKIGEKFVERIIAAYKRHSQMEYKYPAKFLPAALGDNAGMIGAALLVK